MEDVMIHVIAVLIIKLIVIHVEVLAVCSIIYLEIIHVLWTVIIVIMEIVAICVIIAAVNVLNVRGQQLINARSVLEVIIWYMELVLVMILVLMDNLLMQPIIFVFYVIQLARHVPLIQQTVNHVEWLQELMCFYLEICVYKIVQ